MLDGAIIIPIQSMLWNLLFELAALIWIIDRALLIVAYFIMAITGWITQQVFAPMLTVVSTQTRLLVGPVFMVAITVLAFTYIIAVFGRFHVVSLRSAVLWLLFASGLYTFGPNFYLGLESFRRELAGGFYETGVTAFNSGGAVTGLGAIGTPPDDAVTVPTDQLGAFLPIPSVSAVDGVDVALAYLDADGHDMLGAAGAHPIARLPWKMVVAGGDGFFDPDTGPDTFSTLTEAERNASIAAALQGVARLLTGTIIALFAVVEQLVHFILAASFAVAFLSMFVATLFGFFIRTEPIAWSSLELLIELFLQTLVNSLLMSLVVGFVLIGANSGNAILLLGGGAAGLFMAWNLMQGTLKGLMNASERLYKSFASATGGNFATAGETASAMGTAALGAATGAAVLAGGGTLLQAAGGALGDGRTAQTMNYASRMLGGEDTLLGQAAAQVGEGASARTIGGPVGGALLGTQNRREAREQRQEETRLSYQGEADRERSFAVADYRRTREPEALSDTFDEEDTRRVQALAVAYDEPTFDTVANTVRRVRNANPDLPPESAAFQREVRESLPPELQTLEAAAIADFATVFGAAAEPPPGRYEKAQTIFQPIPTPGPADALRDAAVASSRSRGDESALADAFSPDDANRVAQLMDAYDDDDFAAVVAAVRAAREANPDLEPGSTRALSAARTDLPPALAQMPSSDLRAFSTAFGSSATVPAVVEAEAPAPVIYTGNRDERRDTAVGTYRDSGDEMALVDDFSPVQAQQLALLADAYEADDFEAVVRAVRQVRTDDPELEAGSTRAVRATRRLLPDRLRQMPSEDLTAFSNAFGAEADTPNVRTSKLPPKPRHEVRPVPLANVLDADAARNVASAMGTDPEALVITPQSQPVTPPATAPDPTGFAPVDPSIPDHSSEIPQVIIGPSAEPPPRDFSQITPPPLVVSVPPPPPPVAVQPPVPPPVSAPASAPAPRLTDIRGIGPAMQTQLREAGIQTVADLAAADPSQLAQLPRVSETRAAEWVASAAALTPSAPPPVDDGPPPRDFSRSAPPTQSVSRDAGPPPRDSSRTPSPPPTTQSVSRDASPPPRDFSRAEAPPPDPLSGQDSHRGEA